MILLINNIHLLTELLQYVHHAWNPKIQKMTFLINKKVGTSQLCFLPPTSIDSNCTSESKSILKWRGFSSSKNCIKNKNDQIKIWNPSLFLIIFGCFKVKQTWRLGFMSSSLFPQHQAHCNHHLHLPFWHGCWPCDYYVGRKFIVVHCNVEDIIKCLLSYWDKVLIVHFYQFMTRGCQYKMFITTLPMVRDKREKTLDEQNLDMVIKTHKQGEQNKFFIVSSAWLLHFIP